MNTIFTLRFLCVIGFLLLFCPFYDGCSSNEIAVEAATINETNTTNIEKKLTFFDKVFEAIDDGNSQNAFEFAEMAIELFFIPATEFKEGVSEGLKKKEFGGLFYSFKNFSFLFIILFSIANLVLVFTKKNHLVFKFSKWILILLFVSIVCIFLEGFFEKISQFKWGYYSFLIVTLLIFYFSKKVFFQRKKVL